MAPNPALLKALDLASDASDEDISTALTGVLTSAVHDEPPKQTLNEIYSLVVTNAGKDYLDPLHLIPLLLPSAENAAQDILALIGECGSSREVIITAQEAIETLRHGFENEDDEEYKDPSVLEKQLSISAQLSTLVDLYAAAITRIKLRRKPARETIQPFIQEVETTIKVAAPRCNRVESLAVITSVSHLSDKIVAWCNEVLADQDTEATMCKEMIKVLLDCTLIAFSESLQSFIAQRTLEQLFPRHTIFSSSRYKWQQGENAVQRVLSSYRLLGCTPRSTGPFSTSDLFFFAYDAPEEIQPQVALRPLMPVILSALNTNTFVDESLAVLLKIFHAYQENPDKQVLPPDFSADLCSVLPSIASAHPDPLIRNQVFRCLSLVLSASDPHSRFIQLKELSNDPQYPQMSVASVGLVKEGLLRAISDPAKEDKYFVKPLFLPSFGPILFRSNPPDLLTSDLSLKDFQESPESARLVECLSLYYILIHRDAQNLTGIRDPDMRQTIDKNLLSPLKSAIGRWSEGYAHNISPIVSLQISIERIEKAHRDLY
ncbi:hypothetical protein BJ165DRAFT_1522789 [Panaeolus papilionaceus]|nr:hypothetical protein BJ165DRAFT_1522789 [Panaeolus papilionaceus]